MAQILHIPSICKLKALALILFNVSSLIPFVNTLNMSSINPTAPPLTNSQYQIVTLCNSQPSIVKCQNTQHYLIVHRALLGISSTDECTPNPSCMQEYYERDDNTFSCTGSKVCILYPSRDSISLNACHSHKSNLTQLHITCASLARLNEYLSDYNKQLFRNYLELKTESELRFINKDIDQTSLKPSFEFLRNNSRPMTSPLNLVDRYPPNGSGNTMTNAVIMISITIFYSFVALVLITLVFCRLRIKKILIQTRLGVSEESRSSTLSSNQSSPNTAPLKTAIPPSKTTIHPSLIYLKKTFLKNTDYFSTFLITTRRYAVKFMFDFFTDSKTARKNSRPSQRPEESMKRQSTGPNQENTSQTYTYENLHFTDVSCRSGLGYETIDIGLVSRSNLQEIADIVSLSSDDEEYSADNICIVEDLYAYYNPYKQGASSTGYASNFVLYDIPEEDLDDESDNFVEILKI